MPASPLKIWPLVALLMAAPAIAQEASQEEAPGDPTPQPAAPSVEEALDPDEEAPADPAPASDAAGEAADPAPEAAGIPAEGTVEAPTDAGDAAGQVGAGEAANPEGPGALSLGEGGEPEVGQVYVREEFTDWELRCERVETGDDPCQLYQLLEDQQGTAVAEISMFALPEGSQAAAGATIVTPLMTLLTEQLTLTVDGGTARRYPFSWCEAIGCIARVGFTEEEVAAFRGGDTATLSIVPVAAADERVELEVSLSGFTAGFEAVNASGTPPQQ